MPFRLACPHPRAMKLRTDGDATVFLFGVLEGHPPVWNLLAPLYNLSLTSGAHRCLTDITSSNALQISTPIRVVLAFNLSLFINQSEDW